MGCGGQRIMSREDMQEVIDDFKAGCLLDTISYSSGKIKISARKLLLTDPRHVCICATFQSLQMHIWFIPPSFSSRTPMCNVTTPNQTALSPINLKTIIFYQYQKIIVDKKIYKTITAFLQTKSLIRLNSKFCQHLCILLKTFPCKLARKLTSLPRSMRQWLPSVTDQNR